MSKPSPAPAPWRDRLARVAAIPDGYLDASMVGVADLAAALAALEAAERERDEARAVLRDVVQHRDRYAARVDALSDALDAARTALADVFSALFCGGWIPPAEADPPAAEGVEWLKDRAATAIAEAAAWRAQAERAEAVADAMTTWVNGHDGHRQAEWNAMIAAYWQWRDAQPMKHQGLLVATVPPAAEAAGPGGEG